MTSTQPTRQTAWDRADEQRSQSTPRARRPDTQPGKPRFKPHFPDVIRFVYMSRYATGDQIRARFPDTYASDRTGRTTRRHLKELVALRYLATADVKFTGATAPLVYICTGRGTSFLRHHFNLELVEAREESRTITSIEHELMLTEFDLACWQTARARADLDIKFTERRYFHKTKVLRPTTSGGQRLIPDAGFMVALPRGDQPPALLLYFAEMDNGTEPPDVVLGKFLKYDRWGQSDDLLMGPTADGKQPWTLLEAYRHHGAENPSPNFRLLVIARRRGTTAGQDVRRLADLFAQCLELSDPMRNRMYFTTADTLREHQHDDPPLSAPFWIKAADATPWLADYRSYVAGLDKTAGKKPTLEKREYVTQRLADMPRYPMFPLARSPQTHVSPEQIPLPITTSQNELTRRL